MSWTDPTTWYARLPTFHAAAAALITASGTDRLLLVKPTYRDHWTFPGGYVEADEYPHQTCGRELYEELGLQLTAGALLVIDWAPPSGPRPRAIMSLTFDCGDLPHDTAIRPAPDEIETWDFFEPDQAEQRLPANVAPRVAAALRARREHTISYLAGGARPNNQTTGRLPLP